MTTDKKVEESRTATGPGGISYGLLAVILITVVFVVLFICYYAAFRSLDDRAVFGPFVSEYMTPGVALLGALGLMGATSLFAITQCLSSPVVPNPESRDHAEPSNKRGSWMMIILPFAVIGMFLLAVLLSFRWKYYYGGAFVMLCATLLVGYAFGYEMWSGCSYALTGKRQIVCGRSTSEVAYGYTATLAGVWLTIEMFLIGYRSKQ